MEHDPSIAPSGSPKSVGPVASNPQIATESDAGAHAARAAAPGAAPDAPRDAASPPRQRRSLVRRALGPPVRVILFCAVVLYAAESIARHSLIEPFTWAWRQPVEAGVNAAAVLALLLIAWGLIGRLRVAALAPIFVSLFIGLGSAIKGQTLGEPLLPWEVFLARQVTHLPGLFGNAATLTLREGAALALLVVLGIWAVVRLPGGRVRLRYRLAPGLAAVWLPWTMVFYGTSPLRHWYRLTPWEQSENYRVNGQLATFAGNTRMCFITRPPDYSEQRMGQVRAQLLELAAARSAAGAGGTNDYTNGRGDVDVTGAERRGGAANAESTATSKSAVASAPPAPGASATLRPNLIVVMSEAFWDPLLLPGVTIAPDPLAALRARSPGGKLDMVVSPSFGGQTSNVEFEFLTGLSMTPLPTGSNPYQQYIKHELPSLAGLLAARGYDTVAIHPHHRWYWNRDRVYPLLGFSKFIAQDDMIDPPRKGTYITDQSLMRDVAAILDRADKETFVFAVTMQAHWPYLGGAAPDVPLKLDAAMLDEADHDLLLRYSQCAHEAVTALEWLIADLERRPRPSILVFFGDHLPVLGNRMGVYRATGFLDPRSDTLTDEDHYKIRRVPLLVHDTRRGTVPMSEVSIKFLGPRILRQLDQPLPPFHVFLESLSETWPVLTGMFQVDQAGAFSGRRPTEQGDWLLDYRLLQYDLLFGRQYSLAGLF